jgi:hypothetical protein
MEAEADRWMAMLNERLDEAVATLERERTCFEMAFRSADGQWLYWLVLGGEHGAGIEDSPFDIDREHVEFGQRVREPGWEQIVPEALLVPAPVRAAMLAWAGVSDRD